MLYHVTSVEIKSPDWKIISGKGLDNTILENCSVNRVGKPKPPETTGQIFPNFDDIIEGGQVTGEPWTSAQGKQYLFPPRPVKPTIGAPRASGAITKAMDRKEAGIEKSQDRKEDAIARAGAFRDATLVAIAQLKDEPFPTTEEFKEVWVSWVKFFLGKHEEPFI